MAEVLDSWLLVSTKSAMIRENGHENGGNLREKQGTETNCPRPHGINGLKYKEKYGPQKSTAFVVERTGGAERNRTADLFIANEALYQLSYSPPWGGGR